MNRAWEQKDKRAKARGLLTAGTFCLFAAASIFGAENDRNAKGRKKTKNPVAEKKVRVTESQIYIKVNKERIGMGRSVEVTARATLPDSKPAAGYQVLPYVNGKRWGAHELTNKQGLATMHLPLPNPGVAEIQVQILSDVSSPKDRANSKFTGFRMPEEANVSNSVKVQVNWRKLQVIKEDTNHLVGMQWEPWFTPKNASWGTAQAVPLMGRYWSWHPAVTRQHIIWMAESGVNFLVVDWTNHLWGKEHWNQRAEHTNEIIHCTTLALETLAAMRDEDLPVPKVVLFLGLNNGPVTTMTAVNEEIDWIYHNYIRNPRFSGLFLEYLGKPLLLIHNGGGPEWLQQHVKLPVNDKHFTIRWQSSQHQLSGHNEQGYWSWMDGSLRQPVTRFRGKPECLTVSTAFFNENGWRGQGAHGRRGGWTYVESFKSAYKYRPRFIQLHQFQEFAGQREGHGYGPNKDIYVDSYSVELSDDIEPVSLTAPAYRGEGGWGFYYLNLTRALVDIYRQKTPETTVVVVAQPNRREVVTADELEVKWTWAGKAPQGFSISINGKTIARDLQPAKATVDLSAFEEGPMKLVLTAEGTQSRYLLSYTEDSLPLENMVPAFVEVDFVLKRNP